MLQRSMLCSIYAGPQEGYMSNAKRSHSEPVTAATAEKTEVVESVSTLYLAGVERLAEVQKKGIDLAVKQNAESLDVLKKFTQAVPGAPGLFMLDLASDALERYADTQKRAIDLVVEQSHAMAGLVKERVTSTATATRGVAEIVRQSVQHSVAAQKKVLDYSAAQTRATFETAKQQFGLAGSPAQEAAESFQRGVDGLIESQKDLLDMAAKPFTSVH
jgi:hypothetical protein